MEKLLIIGAEGFIGSHLLQHCINEGKYECWGSDVVANYGEKNYRQIDATNSDFNDLFAEQQFTACINCSGAASVPDSLAYPLRDYNLNTVNVFKILEAIRRNSPTCKFLNLSSAAVYGNPAHLPIKETDAVQPLSPYGYHKRQAEVICEEYHRLFGAHTSSVRIFSAFGPGLRKQLLWDIWKKINASSHVRLFGTGSETRDFIYITDLVAALLLVLENARYTGEVYNVANGEEVSIGAVANLFTTHYPQAIISFSGEERKGDPACWKADITLLKNMGYHQQVTMEKGIANYVSWIRDIA